MEMKILKEILKISHGKICTLTNLKGSPKDSQLLTVNINERRYNK